MKKDHLFNAFKSREIEKVKLNNFVGGLDNITEVDYQTDDSNSSSGWSTDCGPVWDHSSVPASSGGQTRSS